MITLNPGEILKLRIGTTPATPPEYYISYVDLKQFELGSVHGTIDHGEYITVLSGPETGVRQIKFFTLSNISGSSLTFILQIEKNDTGRNLIQTRLAPLDTLQYNNDTGFTVVNQDGNSKVTYTPDTIQYVILGQLAPAATTLSDLVTISTGQSAFCTSLLVTNRDAAATTFRVAVRRSGNTISNEHYIYYDLPINGNDTFESTVGITLNGTDVVTVYAGSANLSFNLFGYTK